MYLMPVSEPPYSPSLTLFRHTSPCYLSDRDHDLHRELTSTGYATMDMTDTVKVYSQIINSNRFSHKQVFHSLHSSQAHLLEYLTSNNRLEGMIKTPPPLSLALLKPIPSQ